MMNFLPKSRRRLPALAAGATLAAALLLGADDGSAIEVASSYNPVGSGARAVGMGGAFVAVADDATAASWNPAGLVNLEKPEFSVAYGYLNRDQTYTADPSTGLNGQNNNMDANGINYASFVYPFTLFGKNMVASLNYQRLFDMNKDVKVPFNFDLGGGLFQDTTTSFRQKGYISTLTPAFAIQVIPELYLGAAVNIWDDFLGTSSWETTSSTVGVFPFPISTATHTKSEFSGVNATVGFLANLNNLSIGGVFKAPFTGTLKISRTHTDIANVPPTTTNNVDNDLEMPMSAGLGVSYRFSDQFLVSVDANWTQWSEFAQKGEDAAIPNQQVGSNPFTNLNEKLNDTVQVRLGTEYLFMNGKSVIPVRAGVFYDPEPGPMGGIDKYFGFSVGSGYTWENYSFDVAYQFRKGNNVSSDLAAAGITSTTTQHNVLSSLIYRF